MTDLQAWAAGGSIGVMIGIALSLHDVGEPDRAAAVGGIPDPVLVVDLPPDRLLCALAVEEEHGVDFGLTWRECWR